VTKVWWNEPSCGAVVDSVSTEGQSPGIELDQPGYQAQEGALASAVRADYGYQLAGGDLEGRLEAEVAHHGVSLDRDGRCFSVPGGRARLGTAHRVGSQRS
ncbi:uncharacterized protein METZ01_LOCUS198605, partial [marine metagenome]